MSKLSINQIRQKIQIYPQSWFHIFSTNCYAYALGLDVKQSRIGEGAYSPGYISNIPKQLEKPFTYEELIYGLEQDFNSLGICYREVEPNNPIKNGEWKIALFTLTYFYGIYDIGLVDFHFLRQNSSGIWYHKVGFYSLPIKRDFEKKIITNPKTCNLGSYEYHKCYALSLKR